MEFIENVTKNADEIQAKVLAEILSRNADVEYLKRYGLNGHTDKEDFKKTIPVISYDDIQSDIKRIANGDKSRLLCSEPISEFLTSSGTSGGERKLIPFTEEELQRRAMFNSLLMPVISQYVPGLDRGKGMLFLFVKSDAKTPSGLLARPALTSYFKSSYFKNRPHDPYTNYTSPNEAILCEDYYQSVYCQMLCGLCQNKQVLRVGTGTINSKITDPSVGEAVMRTLKPDPELADFIESECRKDSWQGIIPRLWPNTKYIDAIVTGSMSQYIPTVDYYSNELPIVSPIYAASEGYFGINLDPLSKPSDVSYTLIPTMGYFEFSPLNRNTDAGNGVKQQELVDLVDVKLGEEYEIVVTTYAGRLYRYRVGDLLRVAGFKNNAPKFHFVCRKNVILSIDSDKTDEAELQHAVEKAASHLIPFKARVAEYTSYADTTKVPGHYVLYWELSQSASSNPIPPSVLEDCCMTMEESLASTYRQHRVHDAISPLELRIVEAGTFDRLMDYVISLGGSISQYKTPRCVKSAAILEVLNSRILSSYFSPKCPQWTPRSNYED
ncbi:hypothetical protein F511_40091 [Dorcoceras hygrometricum]|uniref:Indole-3-acetic acid-amido synthetase GH3.6 n=1 Tax=Dorcoceras hygrometricum TaxID=472368 RepID=A0A2Z6ZZV0_9LAMI|nr:hypothetical protein F511_40091 [Dorcoceras hygrometricum]